MHPLTKRFLDQVAAKNNLLSKSAPRILDELTKIGVKSKIVGSFARGDITPESDLDVLILEYKPLCRGVVLVAAEDAAEPGVDVDVVFAEDLSPQGFLRMSKHEY